MFYFCFVLIPPPRAAARAPSPPPAAAAILRFAVFSTAPAPRSTAAHPGVRPRHLRTAAPPRSAVYARLLRRSAAKSISAAAAPRATSLRLRHLHTQANPPNPLIRSAVAPPPPTSSAESPHLYRARRRRTGDGGARRAHQRIRLLEAELGVPSRSAAVDRIAGDVVRGRRRRWRNSNYAGAAIESDPLSLRSDPLIQV